MSQFLKLPMLFQHFFDHNERQPSISFIDFLEMHYWGNDMNDFDQEDDMKLPFKTATSAPIVVCIPEGPVTLIIPQVFENITAYPLPNDSSLPDRYNSSLFRPPRGLVYIG